MVSVLHNIFSTVIFIESHTNNERNWSEASHMKMKRTVHLIIMSLSTVAVPKQFLIHSVAMQLY